MADTSIPFSTVSKAMMKKVCLRVFNEEARSEIGIIEVEQQGESSVLINFTDGTFAFYSVEELTAIHPSRQNGDGENATADQKTR